MDPTKDLYPVYEANQVLTSEHLNNAFDWLDEQGRLTRANLIGIGIVCGLELSYTSGASPVVRITKGCGVTSLGYLAVVSDDLELVAYREYKLPDAVSYPTFIDSGTSAQYELWELFDDGEPETTALADDLTFVNDKAVVLFLELNQEGLRNCSPNNCDDKGTQVTVSVKPLLVKKTDLNKIIAAANDLDADATASDIESVLLAKLNLPDLRVPRFDVPNTAPVTSEDIYDAFLEVFSSVDLAANTEAALHSAYETFKPLLVARYATDPFSNFTTKFGFLDATPATAAQVRFLPYYYACFSDLLAAYEEFRWAAAELACACCPDENLFPRHLLLGGLPNPTVHADAYRQDFLASAAVGACTEEKRAVLQLFDRLVEMTKSFTNNPSLPAADAAAAIDPQIRVTPSKPDAATLGEQAIPYYYAQTGTPPLYKLWNRDKTRRGRANQNLSYRYDAYSPTAPDFVSDPLSYKLEPNNFLRIEGHLGKKFAHVASSLLLLKETYRLPVDVIAVRTGAFDATQEVDLEKEAARFEDLEALYDSLRTELLRSLTEGMMYCYDLAATALVLPAGTPQHPLLKKYAPNYRYPANSVGAWYEKYLTQLTARPYIDVDQNHIDATALFVVYCQLFTGTVGLPSDRYAHAVSIYYFSKLAEVLPDALDALAFADFQNKYEDLLGLTRYLRTEEAKTVPSTLTAFVPEEEFIDHCDAVLFSCKLDPIKAMHDEYVRRLNDLKSRQFLERFLGDHPGAEPKAGVPLGGTFVIVYHQDIAAGSASGKGGGLLSAKSDAPSFAKSKGQKILGALKSLKNSASAGSDPNLNIVLDAIEAEEVKLSFGGGSLGAGGKAASIVTTAVNQLADGTVIADLCLPYLISSSGDPIAFVLPAIAPGLTAEVGATGDDAMAPVSLTAAGGTAPYELKINDADYEPFAEEIELAVGAHTLVLRDVEGVESEPRAVTVPPQLAVSAPTLTCSANLATYTATVTISGGTPPYTVGGTAVVGNTYTSGPILSGKAGSIEVIDSNQRSKLVEFTKTCATPCDLPCAGLALKRGYRFWLPAPAKDKYTAFKPGKVVFTFEYPKAGTSVNIGADVAKIIQATTVTALNTSFDTVIKQWVADINKAIAAKIKKENALVLAYEPGLAGGIGTLSIEYFECLKFDIQVATTFARGQVEDALAAVYAPDGTTLKFKSGETVKIPAFDTVKKDKCNPSTPSEAVCAKTPELELTVTKKVSASTVTTTVKVDGTEKPVAVLWEAQDATPPMTNTQNAKFKFATSGAKVLRLTAFTSKGCRVTQLVKVDIG